MRCRTGITRAKVCIQASKREFDRRGGGRGSRDPPPLASWPVPPADPMPRPGEVAAVFADLAVGPDRLRRLTAGFTPRERQRAESFATDEWRDRWSAARGTLREVLGSALGIAPDAVGLR